MSLYLVNFALLFTTQQDITMINEKRVQDLFDDINALTQHEKSALFIRLIRKNKNDEDKIAELRRYVTNLEIKTAALNRLNIALSKEIDKLSKKETVTQLEAFDLLKEAENKMKENGIIKEDPFEVKIKSGIFETCISHHKPVPTSIVIKW